MKQNYQKTMYACFIGYIVQAIVNNFVPLLFVTFQNTYDIPLSKITLLITINFVIQLFVDMLSAGFIDKIGYRASVIIAHICVAERRCLRCSRLRETWAVRADLHWSGLSRVHSETT